MYGRTILTAYGGGFPETVRRVWLSPPPPCRRRVHVSNDCGSPVIDVSKKLSRAGVYGGAHHDRRLHRDHLATGRVFDNGEATSNPQLVTGGSCVTNPSSLESHTQATIAGPESSRANGLLWSSLRAVHHP